VVYLELPEVNMVIVMTGASQSAEISRTIKIDVMSDVRLPIWEVRIALLQLLLGYGCTLAGVYSSCNCIPGNIEVLSEFPVDRTGNSAWQMSKIRSPRAANQDWNFLS
jgi:hypothetical protein